MGQETQVETGLGAPIPDSTLPGKNQDLARQFAWEIASINVHLQELRHFWAKTLALAARNG